MKNLKFLDHGHVNGQTEAQQTWSHTAAQGQRQSQQLALQCCCSPCLSPAPLLFLRRWKEFPAVEISAQSRDRGGDKASVPKPGQPKPTWEAGSKNWDLGNPCSFREGKSTAHTAPHAILMARETDAEQGILCSGFYFASIWKNDLKEMTASLGFICPHPLKCGNNTFEDCGKA